VERASTPTIERLEVSAYTVPTETPEADGTFGWKETTLVLAGVSAAGISSVGYTFADIAAAHFIDAHLAREILGRNVLNIPELWTRMIRAVRNLGRPGISSMAISAVDNALWDLKARLLNLSVADLLGRAHAAIPAYGSGGFTSYGQDALQRQLACWVDQGMTAVKMKIGSDPAADVNRARGPGVYRTQCRSVCRCQRSLWAQRGASKGRRFRRNWG
jgi:L-alanine-DL-glutamate epimerase-like enolase superfamily enzyme